MTSSSLPSVVILPGGSVRDVERTRRAVVARSLAEHLPGTTSVGWLWIVRAGCWPLRTPEPQVSSTGRPTLLLGLARPADDGSALDEDAESWSAWCERSGGDGDHAALPGIPASLLLDPHTAAGWTQTLDAGADPDPALRALLDDARIRRVRWADADVAQDRRLRVAQVITSLQRGGAERVALDLHDALPALGIATHLILAGSPARGAFPSPAGISTYADAGPRPARMALAARCAALNGNDVVHAHLLTSDDLAAFAARTLPLLVTVHNATAGWPDGLSALTLRCLLVACSRSVEAQIATALPQLPRRTVWNGIDATRTAPTPETHARGQRLRQRLGIATGDTVLAVLANPRAQKRLELLPAVLALLRPRLPRPIHLVMAGEAGAGPGADVAEAEFSAAVATHTVADRVHRVGMIDDVAGLLAASDLLVSPSAWEGLSLVHLEALAAGIPVLSSAVGGAAEVAARHHDLHLLPADADAETWAAAIAVVLDALPPRLPRLDAAFTVAAMTRGYARLYPRATALMKTAAPRGIWLVTNNLSIGGAQSSARRLLGALHAEGIRVRCALLQEDPHHPTPGRTALLGAGIPVLALPPPDVLPAPAACARLAAACDDDPPQAVLLWNVMPQHKLLLAELLLTTPLWDVSPGEMNFASLARVFTQLPADLSLRDARDYGARLTGAIVKYATEAERAAQILGTTVHVIPNGVRLPDLNANRPPRPLLVFGTAARLSPDKRLEDLIAAFHLVASRLPAWELRIAGGPDGDASYRERLEFAAAGLPVRFLGEIDDQDGFLGDLDIFVLVAEPAGCPNASLEAMAHGLPVVATEVGGMREQVEPYVTGLLVPPRDPAALGEALVDIASDAARRATWGAAGRQRIAERFSLERMARDYRRVVLGG